MGLKQWICGDEKFKKSDILLVVFFSFILAAASYYVFVISENSLFYDVAQTSRWLKISGLILSLPATVMMIIFHFAGIDRGGGDDLASYLWEIFTSPVLAFMLWFCLFYIIAKIGSKIFKGKYAIFKHVPAIIIIVFIIIPYLQFFFSKSSGNVSDLCLSGAMNHQMMSGSFDNAPATEFTVGPDYCFADIVRSRNFISSEQKLDFCNGLSKTKIVGSQGDGGGLYNIPAGLSFRDYCLFDLAPLEKGPLCDMVGTDSPDKKSQCIEFFDNKADRGNIKNFYPKDDLAIFNTIKNATSNDRLIFQTVTPSDVDASTTKMIKFAESPISRGTFPNDFPITVSRIEKVYFSPGDSFLTKGNISGSLGTLKTVNKKISFSLTDKLELKSVNGQTASEYYGTKLPDTQIDLAVFDYSVVGAGKWQIAAYDSGGKMLYSLPSWMKIEKAKTSVVIPINDRMPILQFAIFGYDQAAESVTISNVHFAKSDAFQIKGAKMIGYRVSYNVQDPAKSAPDIYVYYLDQTGFKYAY